RRQPLARRNDRGTRSAAAHRSTAGWQAPPPSPDAARGRQVVIHTAKPQHATFETESGAERFPDAVQRLFEPRAIVTTRTVECHPVRVQWHDLERLERAGRCAQSGKVHEPEIVPVCLEA